MNGEHIKLYLPFLDHLSILLSLKKLILEGPLIKSHKILLVYKLSYSRHASKGMVTPFTRDITTKMIACRLALQGLAKKPASALWSFERQ